ncbi:MULTISPECIES: outer membrane lipoprotein-sorting protein [Maricaulis]|jgi:hypothetical protein|uniref:Uncharacterized protein TP-0789 domain-containing protein n=1 Tax=Maricaulis maris (strain MCS10) TaxID=394221 RepID=Q0AT81_MARMM|nr:MULTISPECIES: outer membrane lipoprotein-sorting protein [Maricaulis]ABI64506.1 conserved hypothetical protein [Maricaulis maris MCS10]MAC88638.1 outer membrane lipoprotein-sorting protein [Maricaulis sp.]
MNALTKILIAGAAILGVPTAAAAQEIDVETIVHNASAQAYYQGENGRARARMTIVDSQDRDRIREFTILRTDVGNEDNGDQKFFVLFSRPADVNGTSFLVWKNTQSDDDRWLYLPALDLVRRIAASDERTSFVGSHFFYEDISGRSPVEDDHELVETTDLYFVVESRPRDPGAAEFVRYRSYIHRESFVPVRIDYYDADDTVYRSYNALEVETHDGYPTVIASEIVDSRTGGRTLLRFEDVSYDIDLPEGVFQERYLRNPPRALLGQQ